MELNLIMIFLMPDQKVHYEQDGRIIIKLYALI